MMKRPSNLIPLCAALPALSFVACDKAVECPSPKSIIFIYADDLGPGDLSCYGATRISTPNIDRLASEGVRFENAYSTSATSTPSRYGLLTGCYPWRAKNTGIAPGNSELIIPTECYTLADAMQSAGFKTAAIGKWHLGLGPKGGTDFNNEIRPNTSDIGFDYEYIIPATVDRVPCVFVENGRVVGLDPNDPITVSYTEKVGNRPTGEENPELVRLKPSQGHNQTIINGIPRIGYMAGGESALWVDENIADTITMRAVDFICKNQSRPFFLYMGTQDVHVPRVPHPRFKGKSQMGDRGDVILQLDWTIGEIMRTVDSLGIADQTLIIFTSDNGPVIDDGYADQALELLGDHNPMSGRRGGKYSLYEAGTRIPMIARWSGNIEAGGVQRANFSQIDIFRSLCELIGVKIPDYAAPDSRNHLQELLGRGSQSREFIIQQNLNNTLSIISDGWKYIEPSDKPSIEFWTGTELGNSPTEQLYELATDPVEQHNRAMEEAAKCEMMRRALDSIKSIEPTFLK